MIATDAGSGSGRSGKKKHVMSEGEMQEQVYELFTESQYHISSHRKNVHQLRQVHLEWCQFGGGSAEREEAFFLCYLQCLNIVLGVKKNEEGIGRMIRFMIGFVVYCAEKDEEGCSITSRFIENLLLYCLEGVDAKEKVVRSRLCQLIVACVNSVDELSDLVWEAFRGKMIERLFDREAVVRVHAVHAMARLQCLPIGETGGLEVLDVFMDLLQHDPSYEVRRAVLAQMDVNDRSLPVILARKRDVDPRLRRAFYASKLAEIDMRNLSIQQRDQVLRTGLTDRDQSVRQACIDMIFTNWIHDTNSNLIEFLACLDVMNNAKMAESALECFLGMHPNLFESFDGAYLENLTVETAFILRVFCEWKVKEEEGAKEGLQEMLPELCQMATYIRRAYEMLLVSADDAAKAEVDFVLRELLLTCRQLDFSDEVGRRVLADALLELITNLELGDGLFTEALRLLALQAPTTTEFMELAAGLIADFQEVYQCDGEQQLSRSIEALSLDQPDDSALPEEIRILANLRCLEIIRECLSISTVKLEEEGLLAHCLTDIVIPSVNSHFVVVQAAGLLCLGLGCTLSRDLALEYMSLFFDFVRLGGDETALTSLKIAFDLLFLFGLETFTEGGTGDILDTLSMALYDPRSPIQTVASEGFAKLLLHGILPAPQPILEGLLHLSYHPATEGEARLRQCLAYFFPAYCFSRASNQESLAQVLVPFLKGLAASKQSSLSFLDVASQLVHLTDPKNLINNTGSCAHDQVSLEATWAMIESLGDSPEITKQFLGLATRLSPGALGKATIKKLLYLTSHLSKLVQGTTAIEKNLQAGLKKLLASLVEQDDPEVILEAEEFGPIKARLAPFLKAETHFSIPAAIAKARTGGPRKPALVDDDGEGIANPLDDLDDILQG